MTRNDSYAQHERLRGAMRLEVQREFRSAASIYTRHIGQFFIRRILDGGAAINYIPIQIEKPGRCDDWLVVQCYSIYDPNKYIFPIHMEIETKSGTARLSPKQVIWRDKCIKRHWPWFENRDAKETVINIKNELSRRGLKWVS